MTNEARAAALAAFCVAPALAAVGFAFATAADPAQLFREDAIVEAWSAVALFQGALCWFLVQGRDGWRDWQIPAILTLFALRELDFDKRFTESGIVKLRTYTGDFPLGEKLLGAAVIALLAVVVWRLARRNLPGLWRGVRSGRAWALAAVGGMGLAALGKALDGIGRKLGDIGVSISAQTVARAGMIEEAMELAAWLLLCVAVSLTAVRAERPAGEPAWGRGG
jgi:hypothetical protein